MQRRKVNLRIYASKAQDTKVADLFSSTPGRVWKHVVASDAERPQVGRLRPDCRHGK